MTPAANTAVPSTWPASRPATFGVSASGKPRLRSTVPPTAQNSAVNAADSAQPSSSSSTRTASAPPPELPVRVDPEAGRLLRVGRPDAEQVRALPQQRDLARPGHRGDERDPWIAPRDLAEDDAVTGPRSADDDVGVLVFDQSPRGRDHRRELAALVAPDQEPGAAAAGQWRIGDAVRGFGRTEVRAAVEKRQLGACEHQILVAAEEASAIDDHADTQRRRAGGERGREARCGGEGCCHEEDRPTTHRT